MKMAVQRVAVNVCTALALLTVAAADVACAQASAPANAVSQDAAIPVVRLISTIAEKTGKKFVIDPKVQAEVVLIGQDPSNLDYAGLLAEGWSQLERDKDAAATSSATYMDPSPCGKTGSA